jgi:hypothetical protein
MPKKTSKSDLLVSFKIDAFTPETMPIDRLAKYIAKFAELLGNENNVHFLRVGRGSCVLEATVDSTALPKLRERANKINDGSAPKLALRARHELNELLAEDNAVGEVILSSAKVIQFPGRRGLPKEEVGPIARPSSIDGNIWSIGGKDETINVQLRNQDQDFRCVVSVGLARRLAPYLFGKKVRLTGVGQWYRTDGTWKMKSLTVSDFNELDDSTFEETLGHIRAVFSGLSPDDFAKTMEELRHG